MAGGASYGLHLILPREQKENPQLDRSIVLHYRNTRKVCLVKFPCAACRPVCVHA